MGKFNTLQTRTPHPVVLWACFRATCLLILLCTLSWSQSANRSPGNMPALSGTPAQLDPELMWARSLLDDGKVEQAEQTTHAYLRTHPDSADAHFMLGVILFKAVKVKESLAEYTEGSKHREPSPYDLEIVALDYVLLRDYMDADKWLTRSLERNPQNAEGWYYLGRTKYNENRFEEAVRAFEQSLRLAPANVKSEDNLGLCYAALGRTDEAIAAYRLAIGWQAEKANKDPGPLLDLGTLLVDESRANEAIPYLIEAAQLSPTDSKSHEQLGKAYERENKFPEAQTELEKAVELSPQDAALHYLLGRVYQKQRLIEKAKAEFNRSGELSQAQASKAETH
jgi:Flp pilus assembly protein TadD